MRSCVHPQMCGEPGTLRYCDQVSPYVAGDQAAHGLQMPCELGTIRHFARVFLVSLFGEADPTIDQKLQTLLRNLHANEGSALFHGYGWVFEYAGKAYSKN